MNILRNLWESCQIHKRANDLPPSYWSNALAGEVGEFANWIKKLDNPNKEWNETEAMEEHADIFIYWVLMAKRLGWTMNEVLAAISVKLMKVEKNAKDSKDR